MPASVRNTILFSRLLYHTYLTKHAFQAHCHLTQCKLSSQLQHNGSEKSSNRHTARTYSVCEHLTTTPEYAAHRSQVPPKATQFQFNCCCFCSLPPNVSGIVTKLCHNDCHALPPRSLTSKDCQ